MTIIIFVALIALLCWAVFNLAVYIMPCFLGLYAGLLAVRTGAGALGGILVAIIVAGAALGVARGLLEARRGPVWRLVILALFAGPAAFTGYQAALQLTALGIDNEFWRHSVALLGGGAVGATALARLTHGPERAMPPSP